MRFLCPNCQAPQAHGGNVCTECGYTLHESNVYASHLLQPIQTPPPTIDEVHAIPGPLSKLYEVWHGKRVRLKSGIEGKVVGVDSCPLHTNREGEYLWLETKEPHKLHADSNVISTPLSQVEKVL